MAVGYRKGIALFDAEDGTLRAILRAKGHQYFRSLSYSMSGTCLLTVSTRGVALFDVFSGKIIADMKVASRDDHFPCDVALSPDSSRIATSFLSNEVALCDARPAQRCAPIKEGLGTGFSDGRCWIAFTSDGRSIVTASRSEDMSRVLVRRRNAYDGKLETQQEITQPGGRCPYLYPKLFSAMARELVLVGANNGTRFVPESNMGIVNVREGVIGIFDTSHLSDARTTTEAPSR
jgi:hypothetical protein